MTELTSQVHLAFSIQGDTMQNSNPDCVKWASHFMSMSHGNCKKWKDKFTKVQSINNLQSVDLVIPPQQKVSGAEKSKVLMNKDTKVKKSKSIKKRGAKGDPNPSTKRVRPSKKAVKTSTTNKRRRDRLDSNINTLSLQ